MNSLHNIVYVRGHRNELVTQVCDGYLFRLENITKQRIYIPLSSSDRDKDYDIVLEDGII